MEKTHTTILNPVDLIERPSFKAFNFDRIQVAPQGATEVEEFHSLSLPERQAIVHRLIERVKSL